MASRASSRAAEGQFSWRRGPVLGPPRAVRLDAALGLPLLAGPVVKAVGMVLLVLGAGLAWWAVIAQARIGRGTPVPMLPTQKLVVVPPFTYCRNPMTWAR